MDSFYRRQCPDGFQQIRQENGDGDLKQRVRDDLTMSVVSVSPFQAVKCW